MEKIIKSNGIRVLSILYILLSFFLLFIVYSAYPERADPTHSLIAVIFGSISIITGIGLLLKYKLAHVFAVMILIVNYFLLIFFYFPEQADGELYVKIGEFDLETLFVSLFALFVIWQTYILLKKNTRELFYGST